MSHHLLGVNPSDKLYRFFADNVKHNHVEVRNFFLILILGYVFSAQVAYAAKYDQLSQKAQQLLTVCQGCHGESFSGQEQFKAPAIAGQSLGYLNRQIDKFRAGTRGGNEGGSKKDSAGRQMANIALTLNDSKSLLEINQYISQLTFIPETSNMNDVLLASVIKANESNSVITAQQLRQGSNYYQGKCGACHGGNAEGNEKMSAPRLNHLSSTYLLRQMASFSNGTRGGRADDKYGRQMAMMAKTSSGQELSNIILFINRAGMKVSVSADHE
jgi:cytochrome c oxidase subunit 2